MAVNPFFTTRGLKLIDGTYFGNIAADIPASFKLVLCTKKNEKSLNSQAAVDKGGGKVGIPVTVHGYTTGMTVALDGTTNYDGRYLVDADSSTNEIVIVATYVAETFTGAETVHEAPGRKTKTIAELQEIDDGNGYDPGGQAFARDMSTGFDNLTENDTLHEVTIQLQNIEWTASGGTIPPTGDGIRYPVIADDDDNVIAYFDLGTYDVVSTGQKFTLQDAEFNSATE